MPALVESEEEEEEDMDSKDPLPEKLHNSMVTEEFWRNEKMLYSYVEDNEWWWRCLWKHKHTLQF